MGGPHKHDLQLAEVEARIGYAFRHRELLREALTHASALDGKKKGRSYDRLEFLGDRVLGLIVAERLLRQHEAHQEGDLASLYNTLVDRRACARAARAAGLGEAVVLSPSEAASGGRGKEAILGDLCESVIAALYLDGGFEVARAFVTKFWGEAFEDAGEAPRDAKIVLNEWAGGKQRSVSYSVIDRSGPEHAPHFVVEARVEGYAPARGEGGSKREAQRAAAAAFLKEHGVDG